MEVRLDERGNIDTSASGRAAVEAQAQVLAAHIRGRLIMRLGLYVLAAVFVITASLLVVFAPTGRETATTLVAMALFALAAGAAGFSAFAIRGPGISVEGDSSNERRSPTFRQAGIGQSAEYDHPPPQ